MTWEPKNGLHDEDVDVSDEEDGDNSFTKDEKPNALGECEEWGPTKCKSQCLVEAGGELLSLPGPLLLSLSFSPG